jgi:hypothetical protein
MVEEGKKKNIVVFPGVEVTTSTGADGVHLLVVGDLDKTTRDFDILLGGILGFVEPDYPRFRSEGGNRVPCSSGKSVIDVLSNLSRSSAGI